MSRNLLNIDSLPFDAFDQLMQLDRRLVGTPNYMGIAYFWNIEYKHYLRDCTYAQRRKIHNKFIKAGLHVMTQSEAHDQIILQVLWGKKLSNGHIVTETELRKPHHCIGAGI